MHTRVVRFTDVSPERMEGVLSRIQESGGPPEGVRSTGITVLVDEAQRTAVVLQHFDTAEDMEAGARILGGMDVLETPGARSSVDMCELKLDLKPVPPPARVMPR